MEGIKYLVISVIIKLHYRVRVVYKDIKSIHEGILYPNLEL